MTRIQRLRMTAPNERVLVADVIAGAARVYGCTPAEILAPTRVICVAWRRQMAMAVARAITMASYPAIARAFGGKHHTTVLHAVEVVTQRNEALPDHSATFDAVVKASRLHAAQRILKAGGAVEAFVSVASLSSSASTDVGEVDGAAA